jgi:hypothetical protein
MIEDPPGLDVRPETSGPEELGGKSLLDRVKARRDERDSFLTIDIPSWDGELKARYQVLHRSDIEKMVKRIRARQNKNGNDATSGSDADLDFLIKACVGIVAHDNETDEEEVIADGYVLSLAAMLEPHDEFDNPIDITNERQLVAYLMGKGDSSIALASHSMKVARWMQDTTAPVEDPQ